MSLLGSFSRTTSCALSTSTKTPPARVMTLAALTPPRHRHHHHHHQPHHHPRLHQLPHQPRHPRRRRDPITSPKRPLAPSAPAATESLFLAALARAGLCRRHARALHSLGRPPHSPPPSSHARFSTHPRRDDSPPAPAAVAPSDDLPQPAPVSVPREELRSIVDQYDFHGYQETPTPSRDPDPEPRSLRVPPIPPRDPLPPGSPQQQHAIDYLLVLLDDELTPHTALYSAYKALPQPRVSYLSNDTIRKLMHHFSVVEYRDERSMLRYLSLVDDLFAAHIPMIRMEWNSAISFAGRYVRKVTDVQVETATQIWLRMEKEAGLPSNSVTFNILFDVATKAGKFALAEVIMQEMVNRKLKPNRYFRTNKIYYYGLKRDGEAVRAAYRELVDAGEFVDTIVLNCVIASLTRAGEASAAEQVFERMKGLDAENHGTRKAVSGWRGQRDLGRVLNKAARALQNLPDRRTTVQKATPLTPNMHTYRLLIKYHAHESGNIDRVSELLDQLHDMDIPMHGSIFYQLFRGFNIHGGVRYSSWTKAKLDNLWLVFCKFVEQNSARNQKLGEYISEEDRGCYFDSGVIVAVLQAYNKVAGKETTFKVWQEILELWKPSETQLESVNTTLGNMFA